MKLALLYLWTLLVFVAGFYFGAQSRSAVVVSKPSVEIIP